MNDWVIVKNINDVETIQFKYCKIKIKKINSLPNLVSIDKEQLQLKKSNSFSNLQFVQFNQEKEIDKKMHCMYQLKSCYHSICRFYIRLRIKSRIFFNDFFHRF